MNKTTRTIFESFEDICKKNPTASFLISPSRGAKGLTDDTPLSLMYRHAREARIYDGPDEVHVQSVARRILKNYQNNGAGWDFGERDASLNSD